MKTKGYIEYIAKAKGISVQSLIIDAIEQSGSISNAARYLGVTPPSIHYQLDKHGLTVVSKVTVEKK